MLIIFLFFVAGFIALWKGADFFVKGASNISLIFNIPSIIIGLTIVAFGTSLPELVVNALASMNQESDLVLGNILGSNIANIGLILGVIGSLAVLQFPAKTVRFEIPVCIGTLCLLILGHYWMGSDRITQLEGILLIVLFAIAYFFSIKRNLSSEEKRTIEKSTQTPLMAIIWIVIGLGGIVGGGRLVIDNSIALAELLGISKSLIGLFGVALGTSLPELITGIAAYRQKNVDLVVGNVIGSNIFNTLLVLGVSATISDIALPAKWLIDIMVCALFTIVLFVILRVKHNTLPRLASFSFLLCGYMAYTLFIFYRG